MNRRWIPVDTVEWVKRADRILIEHGAVSGARLYAKRHQARHRARRLMRLMVELDLHPAWELGEHVAEHDGRFTWAVEYQPSRGGSSE